MVCPVVKQWKQADNIYFNLLKVIEDLISYRYEGFSLFVEAKDILIGSTLTFMGGLLLSPAMLEFLIL